MSSVFLLALRYALVAAAVVGAYYSALFARASFLFQQDTAASVPAAVHLVPYNSAYLARLARWQPGARMVLLHRAVTANPFDADSWMQLGMTAEMQQHDVASAERYFLQAAAIDHMFLPKWTLTNFYFRQQREDPFFRWARATLVITPYLPDPVFEQMWLISQDARQIAAAIPDRSFILLFYTSFLSKTNRYAEIAPIVQRLITAAGNSTPSGNGRDAIIAPVEDRLLAAGYLHPALQIWTSMKDGGWINLPIPTATHPLTNGDFATPFFRHGFDWTPVAPTAVSIAQLADQKEVRLTFSGMEPDHCSLLQQYVPLQPHRSYRFEWQAEAQGLESPSGLAWHLYPVRQEHGSEPRPLGSGDLLSSPQDLGLHFPDRRGAVSLGARVFTAVWIHACQRRCASAFPIASRAAMKSRAGNAVLRTLAVVFGNAWGQFLLERSVAAAQRLQGIGSGGDVHSSGEAAVISKLKAARPAERPLCIFDVGANKGQFLTFACNALGSREFHLHAFEPNASAYAELCQTALNYPRVALNNFALGSHPGEADLFYDAPGSGLASLSKRNLTHFGVEMRLSEKVRIETLDAYCADRQIERIDLLKIDVEGHELDVLNGAQGMFGNAAVGMATFEFGGCNIDTRTFLRDFFSFFSRYKMRIARITPSGYFHELRSYREVFEQFRTTNFVCYPSAIISERRL